MDNNLENYKNLYQKFDVLPKTSYYLDVLFYATYPEEWVGKNVEYEVKISYYNAC